MTSPFFHYGLHDRHPQKPVLVFLHGLFGGLGNFEDVIKPLQREFPIVVPELPLFKDSQTEPTLAGLLWWLDAFLESINTSRVTLIGNSLGGQLACLYATLRPAKIHSLVLTGSAGMGEKHIGVSLPRRFDRKFIREKAALTFYEKQPSEALIDEIAAVISNPVSLRRLLSLSRDSMRTRLESVLPEIQHPVLLIWGKNDLITPLQACEAFQKGLPNAKTAVFDCCGHAPMMEHPELFAAEVHHFLSTKNETRELVQI